MIAPHKSIVLSLKILTTMSGKETENAAKRRKINAGTTPFYGDVGSAASIASTAASVAPTPFGTGDFQRDIASEGEEEDLPSF